MARPRDLLQRFRLAGTRGAGRPWRARRPGGRGRRRARPGAGPLADATSGPSGIRAGAEQEAALRRRGAEERAHADLAAARRDATAERADAAARVRRDADVELAALLADASRRRSAPAPGRARIPEYVDRVVAALRAAVLGSGRDRRLGGRHRAGPSPGPATPGAGRRADARPLRRPRRGAGRRWPARRTAAGRPGRTWPRCSTRSRATLLWHLRVLAGWLPRDGARQLRLLAGGFEIANVDEHLRRLPVADGAAVPAGHPADRLVTAGGRHLGRAAACGAGHLPVGRPRTGRPRRHGTRPAAGLGAAGRGRRARRGGVGARRDRAAAGPGDAARRGPAERPVRRAGDGPARRRVRRGPRRPGAPLPDLRAPLPGDARWALAGVEEPADLWRAEAAWWHRVEQDAARLLRSSAYGPGCVLGVVGVLAADAWRVRAALGAAARGAAAREVFDALA